MKLLKKLASGSLAASLLVSLLAVSAGTALAAAASITGAASSTAASTTAIPPTGVATALSTAPVLTGTVATDAAASGTLVLTVVAPFSFDCTTAPTLTPLNATFTGAVACAAQTLTSTFATTTAGTMSVTWNGVKVKTTTHSASSAITATVASAAMTPASVVVANVTSAAWTYGTAVLFDASSTSVPADGASTIVLTFAGYSTATNNVTITTTNGRFTSTAASNIVIGVTQTIATVTNPLSLTAGGTLTLTAPSSPGTANVTIQLTPVIGGTATTDSITTFHFTATGGRDRDRGMGHGARKVGFFLDPTNATCPTGAQPVSGAPTYGFAILNTTGHGKLIVNVVLKGALPNATYDIWVNQDPGACPLGAATKVGAVHTNAKGNGTGHVKVAIVEGAKNFWVSATSGGSVLRTRAAVLNLKHHH